MSSITHPTSVPTWLDCDPGNDDAFAVLLGAFHPAFNLVGMSTVHGNVPIEKTTHNTVALLDVFKFKQDEVKVYKGEATPLAVEALNASNVHGASGMGGASLPESPSISVSTDKTYLEAMRDAAIEHENELCVVLTGAYTNFARFVQEYPEHVSKIKFVSMMGGAFSAGNITKWAEFNVRADPHAAKIIFDEPALADKLILAPLNITHTAVATDRVRARIYNPEGPNNSPVRAMLSKVLEFYSETYKIRFNNYLGPPIHDPLALFMILPMVAKGCKSLADFADLCDFHYLHRKLSVVTEGEQIGRTDYVTENMDPLRIEPGGVFVGQSVNLPMFWDYIFTALELADKQISERS